MKIENAEETQKSDDLITNNPAFEIEGDPRLGRVFSSGKVSDAEVDTTRSAKKRRVKSSQESQPKKFGMYKENAENQHLQAKRELRTSTDSGKTKTEDEEDEDEQSICSDF